MPSRVELPTPRLVLRPFARAEEDVFFAIESHRKIQPMIDGVTERRKARGSLEHMLKRLEEDGYGLLAITLREGGQVIGIGGLLGCDFSDDVQVLVAVTEEGQGYGTEAAAAALNWGFRVHNRARVLGLVRPGNTPSLRLIEKLSGRPLGDAPTRGPDAPRMLLYEFLSTAGQMAEPSHG
jgi:RimJ/RimL family protein N-acetyltransferase